MSQPSRPAATLPAFLLILATTVLGLAGTDLVLPAIPSIPQALGGTLSEAQFVLAAFVAGGAVGLLVFGTLGSMFDQRRVLAVSLLLYAATSGAAAFAPSMDALIGLRLAQGFSGAAAAVYAPGFLRALYPPDRAVRALGALSSVESLVPALAPVAGAWLLTFGDWAVSFQVTAALSLLAAVLILTNGGLLPANRATPGAGSYVRLFRNPVFLRYALSQAFTLGGLLILVFGAPTVIVHAMGGTLNDFIAMQVCGITLFILAANTAGFVVQRFGAEPTILAGSVISATGALGMLVYALIGGTSPLVMLFLFLPVNMGLGLRGPPGFLHAMLAADGDDARGSALTIFAILLTTAVGTGLAAPFIDRGLISIGAVAATISCLSPLLLMTIRPSSSAPAST